MYDCDEDLTREADAAADAHLQRLIGRACGAGARGWWEWLPPAGACVYFACALLTLAATAWRLCLGTN